MGTVISIVDDDESVRKAIKRLLTSVGFSTEDFGSAEEFLTADRALDSSCLILDVRLPGINGLELQSQLIAAHCQVPIIFISGQSGGQAQARALEAGAVDFLQKPFSERDLLKAISTSLLQQSSAPEVHHQEQTI